MIHKNKIASRILSKHLNIEDNYDDSDNDIPINIEHQDEEIVVLAPSVTENGNKSVEEQETVEIKDISEGIEQKSQDKLKENTSEIVKAQNANEGDEKMVEQDNSVDENEECFNNEEEVLILSFDKLLDNENTDGNNHSHLDDVFYDGGELSDDGDAINFEQEDDQIIDINTEEIISEILEEEEIINIVQVDTVEKEQPTQIFEFEQVEQQEYVEQPDLTYNFIDSPQDNIEVEDNYVDLKPSEDINIIEDILEDQECEYVAKDLPRKRKSIVESSEEEDILNELIANYDELKKSSNSLKDFLYKNVSVFTKERLQIYIEDSQFLLEEYIDFFEDILDENKREKVYNKLRENEFQYLFEKFIKGFEVEGFKREKTAVNGKIIKNVTRLHDPMNIDAYSMSGSIEQIEIQRGGLAFILSHDLELDISKHMDDIRTARLNCDNVYIVVLKGTVVEEKDIEHIGKYDIKILCLDIPISTINKNLEIIKKRVRR